MFFLFFLIAATTNFVGKFTQSVRRIVQDVKDEGAPSKTLQSRVSKQHLFKILYVCRWYEPRGSHWNKWKT